MSTHDFYSSRRGKRELPKLTGQPVPSPIEEGKMLVWKRAEIPAEKVWDMCVKSRYNPRISKFITEKSLGSMLDEIRAAKRNSFEVHAFLDDDGKYHILAGMRRSTAVSLSPGATLHLLYCETLSDAEQRHFARVSDKYKEPSAYEYGLQLKEIESESGTPLSQRQAKDALGVSLGKVNLIYKSLNIPDEVFDLIGHPDYVSIVALEELTKQVKLLGGDEVVKVVQKIDFNSMSDIESEDRLKAHVTALIKSAFKKREEKNYRVAPALSSVWEGKLTDGAKVKRTKRGELVIKLPEKLLTDDIEERLAAILKGN